MTSMDEEVEEVTELRKHRTNSELLDEVIELLHSAYAGWTDGEANVSDIMDALVVATVLKKRGEK